MSTRRTFSSTLVTLTLALLCSGVSQAADTDSMRVGSQAPELTLKSANNAEVSLSNELQHGPVVLVVLRGWPGYQCPFCTRQFGDLLAHADDFAKKDATVLFVYPGPADNLRRHSEEFQANRKMPENFRFVNDPDLHWVSAHGLRWDAPNETAFPSTFVINANHEITWALISKTHGGRAMSSQLLEVIPSSRPKSSN